MEERNPDIPTSVEHLKHQLQEALAALEQAREELAQRERLALLGQIAVGIGHELRQPLSVISNIAYCLRSALEEKGGGAKSTVAGAGSRTSPATHLDRLDEQVAEANRIIAGLMDYARTNRPRRRPTDLNELVEQQAARLNLSPQIHLRKLPAPDLPSVLADPLHLERVFHILAANALQSMEAAGGELYLRTYFEPGWVVLEVSDTGGGIPEELRAKIFRPFFSGKAHGIGLGLALARQLVEANEGRISFCSESGRGAVFQVRLPERA